MDEIRIALAGIGNVASALLQGIVAKNKESVCQICLRPVVGFDVHSGKVSLPMSRAVQVAPNCATWLGLDLAELSAPILRGPLLDGLSSPLCEVIPVDHNATPVDVTEALKDMRVDVLLILVPTGANEAAHFYAEAAFRAKCAVVNGMPADIINSLELLEKSKAYGVPVIGDDTKSQIGATAIHRALMDLFRLRSAVVDRTIQLDWGGDTDFLNLVSGHRYNAGKRRSKTEAVVWNHPGVQAHISASDYVPFLGNRKEAYTRVEGRIFGGQRVRIDVHLEVEDGYNAAGMLYDAVICAGLALRHGIAGPLDGPSAWFCKRPREQMPDSVAYSLYESLMKQLLKN